MTFVCRGRRLAFIYRLRRQVSLLIARESIVINRLLRLDGDLCCYKKIQRALRWQIPHLVRLREELDSDERSRNDRRLKRSRFRRVLKQLDIVNDTADNVYRMCLFIADKEAEDRPLTCNFGRCHICTDFISSDLPPL